MHMNACIYVNTILLLILIIIVADIQYFFKLLLLIYSYIMRMHICSLHFEY